MMNLDQAAFAPAIFVQEPDGSYRQATGNEVLQAAHEYLGRKIPGTLLDAPNVVRSYLRCRHAEREYEVFGVLFLDTQHRVIAVEDMFRGTISQTSVYPREVVRRALQVNAAACVFYHNHPSGEARPSRADEALTQTLKSALALVDVRALDHFIITSQSVYSMAENGLM
ncbi:MAG: JAB domain-containing protein [Halothiobacillaceae bacterium]|nr:JAB domain-containing protein [Halothiobacillaceae bacterium]